jgi:hypothetical protein
MTHSRRDEILTEYGLPSGDHPDYEIDHLKQRDELLEDSL